MGSWIGNGKKEERIRIQRIFNGKYVDLHRRWISSIEDSNFGISDSREGSTVSSRTDKGVFTANTLMRHFDMHGFALISFQNHLHTYKTKIIASQSLYTLLMIRIGTCCRYYIEFLTETFFIRLGTLNSKLSISAANYQHHCCSRNLSRELAWWWWCYTWEGK